jgi:peptide/nickel transport system substrate-binding protein
MMKKFIKVTILLVLLTLLLVSSCLVGFTAETKEKVITFARPEEIQKLDPYNAFKVSNKIMDFFLYDRLVEKNPETGGGFVPGLATEWNVSSDGTEFTFILREGVKFHNGEPFNAECVKVSLDRFQKEILSDSSYWTSLKEVEIVDDYKVIIRFNEPNVLCLLNLRQTAMLPAKAFTEKGTDLFFEHPIGTGAFILESFAPGQELVLKKNPEYWGEPAYVDKFIYLNITEDSTRIAGVHTGEIDIADTIPAEQISSIEANPNIEVLRVPAWDEAMLGVKCDKPPFTDIKFRQAVTLAIDRENIVKYITKGGQPATGVLPEGIFGFDDSIVPLERDIEKAKQLVKESIYDGREIVILAPTGWVPKTKDVLQAVQGQLIEAGINAKLEIIDGAAYVEKRAAGKYDLFFTSGSFPGDVSNFLTYRVLHSEKGNIALNYVNEELDELIVKQTKEVDEGKRIEILRKIENIMNAEVAPWLFLYQTEQIFVQRKGIVGARYYYDKCPDLRYVHYEE